MLPISRCKGGTTRPRDLRIITKSRGAPLSLPPDTPIAERVSGSSRKSGEAVGASQWPWSLHQSQNSIQGSEGRGELLCEISALPPHDAESHLSGNIRPQTISHVNTILTRSPAQLSFASQQTRGFHTSSSASYYSNSYNADVPDFFIKHKQHRAASSDSDAHERDGPGLMSTLTNSVLSGDVVATIRCLKAKIPVEHETAGGCIIHPSGFVVPGPGHISTSDVARAKERERDEKKDRAVQTVAIAHRVLETDFEQVNATTLPSLHKIPFEVRELDGTIKHPSGFVPPTPAHKFRYAANNNALWDRKVSAVRQLYRQPSPARAVLRAVHTAPASKSSGGEEGQSDCCA